MSAVRCRINSNNDGNNSPVACRRKVRERMSRNGCEKEGEITLIRPRTPRQWKQRQPLMSNIGRRRKANTFPVSLVATIIGLASCLLVNATEGFVVGRRRVRSRRLIHPPSDLQSTTTPDADAATPDGAIPITANTDVAGNNSTATTSSPRGVMMMDHGATANTHTPANHTNNSSSSNSNSSNKYNNKIMDLATYEEHELKEMEWLVRSTATLLCRDKIDDDNVNEQAGNTNNIGGSLPVAQTKTKAEIRRVHLVMKAWARRSPQANSNAPRVVEKILQRLVEERDAGSDDANDNNNGESDDKIGVITTKTYNILLDAWSQSREEGSAERAEQILSEMETLYLSSGNEALRPNESSYNACIKAHVKNGSNINRNSKYSNRNSNGAESVDKAEAILKRMAAANANRTMEHQVTPNRRSYNLLLYALANSSFVDAAERADRILGKMLAAYRQGDENVKPDINSYNQVIASWARGKVSGFEYRMQSVLDTLLRDSVAMKIQPNADTFNTVMGGWLKSHKPEAQERIENVLEKMQTSFANGNEDAKPDRISINTVIAAFCKNGGTSSTALERAMEMRDSMESEYSLKPDTVTNNILVDSWCKSRRPDAPERVVELLDVMERSYKKGKGRLKPDSYTYSSVIDSYTKCSRVDAGERAEEILERMRDLHRNHGGDAAVTSVYNAVINAWASSEFEDTIERVEALMREMEECTDDPFVPRPNRITYNTCLKAMRNGSQEEAVRAEQILTSLEERADANDSNHDNDDRDDFYPDSYSYTAVISAYGRSDAPHKAQAARAVLQRMVTAFEHGNRLARPNVHAFNAALNACAFSGQQQGGGFGYHAGLDNSSQRDAFRVALDILKLLHSYTQADHTTYGTMLRACSSLLPARDKQRESAVETLFHRARQEGQVGRLVVTQVRFAASPELYKSLLQGRDISEKVLVQDLPREWSRNVRENNRRAKKSSHDNHSRSTLYT